MALLESVVMMGISFQGRDLIVPIEVSDVRSRLLALMTAW